MVAGQEIIGSTFARNDTLARGGTLARSDTIAQGVTLVVKLNFVIII